MSIRSQPAPRPCNETLMPLGLEHHVVLNEQLNQCKAQLAEYRDTIAALEAKVEVEVKAKEDSRRRWKLANDVMGKERDGYRAQLTKCRDAYLACMAARKTCEQKFEELQAEYATCKAARKTCERELAECRAQLEQCATG